MTLPGWLADYGWVLKYLKEVAFFAYGSFHAVFFIHLAKGTHGVSKIAVWAFAFLPLALIWFYGLYE
jgi:hypothetical protein